MNAEKTKLEGAVLMAEARLEAGQDREGRVLTTKGSFSQESTSIPNVSTPNRRASKKPTCEEGERDARWVSQQTRALSPETRPEHVGYR